MMYMSEINWECEKEINEKEREICEVWVSDSADRYITLGSSILLIWISSLAFWFGKNLYSRLVQDSVLSPLTRPVVGEVITLNTEAVTSGISPSTSPPQAVPVAIP